MPPKSAKGKPEKPTKQVVRVHQNRKKKAPEQENNERWLLTYADMITLLLALFIILFAISKPPSKIVYDRLAREISGGFGGTSAITLPVRGPQSGMVTQPSQAKDESTSPSTASSKSQTKAQAQAAVKAAAQEAKMKILVKELKVTVKKLKMEKRVVITRSGRGVVISLLTDHTSFDSGSAVLRPGTAELLTAIGPFLARINNEIRVEGNTDNVPIATSQYPTNWELSSARAISVTRYLAENLKVNAIRLSAAGYGQYKPQADNLTDAHRQLNRRVDIVILNTRPVSPSLESQDDNGNAPAAN
jgi:chemotaxis protein MotB